ncbi:MAG: hypothetical protein JWQ03_2976 [Variovorax sp.]|nr:hypothetical protein [Variovorax sp.]
MRRKNISLFVGALALVASSAFAQTGHAPATTPHAAGTTSTPSAPSAANTPATGNQPAPVVMLVPVQISNQALESGCWAQFYDERDFKGDILTLVGPAEFSGLDNGSGRQLKRNIDSLVLGSKATLHVYEHQMFKDRSVQFGPNAREAGLVRKLGFGGRIQSLKLDCAT